MLLSKGNSKLSKEVLTWSITPIKSCPNCIECKDTCYAKQAYLMYPTVKKAWDKRFEMAKDRTFKNLVIKDIARARKIHTIRIHVAGDFFNQEYINDWQQIIEVFPEYQFYTYTKTKELFNFEQIESLSNFNLVDSITPIGINYGDLKHCKKLINHYGYKLCPAGIYDKIVCGQDCKLCHTEKNICFLKH